MAYILRARNHHTLVHNGREYHDGDKIAISKAEADRISKRLRGYRFEDAGGDAIEPAAEPKKAVTAP